jgi:hypothetical protein
LFIPTAKVLILWTSQSNDTIPYKSFQSFCKVQLNSSIQVYIYFHKFQNANITDQSPLIIILIEN